MEIKKSTLYIGVILLILIGGFLFFKGGSSIVNGNVVYDNGEVFDVKAKEVQYAR